MLKALVVEMLAEHEEISMVSMRMLTVASVRARHLSQGTVVSSRVSVHYTDKFLPLAKRGK